ncbi:MAG: hypothetical protein PHE01_01760 [Methanosarcina sp.]|nr:hypothetical protein [Methanosarcina sp.]
MILLNWCAVEDPGISRVIRVLPESVLGERSQARIAQPITVIKL